MRKRFQLISLELDTYTYKAAVIQILDWAKQRKSAYVTFSNVHMTIEAYDNPEFAAMVNNADMVCADGMPLVKGVKLLYNHNIERIAGMDMFPRLLKEANKEKLSIFLYGSTAEVLAKIQDRIKKEYPAAKVVGAVSPSFRKLSEAEEHDYIQQINTSSANMVFVALGCPKQEKWMAKHTSKINAVLLGVGGAFPVFIEEQKRAPEWMRNMSLEWFYRLIQDPKRLFKRYFYTNIKFMYLLAMKKIKKNGVSP